MYTLSTGAQKVFEAIPHGRPSGKPLWLRMEWNMVNLEDLGEALRVLLESRGLLVEIPEVRTWVWAGAAARRGARGAHV